MMTRRILLRMRNVSDKICTENQKKRLIFNYGFPKIVPFTIQCGKYGRTRQATYNNTIRCMRFTCWITKINRPTIRI